MCRKVLADRVGPGGGRTAGNTLLFERGGELHAHPTLESVS